MKNQALFAKYASKLTASRENIEKHWQIFSEDASNHDALEQLEMSCHNLVGTGVIDGCGTLSALASAINQRINEDRVEIEQDAKLVQNDIQQLLAVMDQAIEEVSKKASEPSAPSATNAHKDTAWQDHAYQQKSNRTDTAAENPQNTENNQDPYALEIAKLEADHGLKPTQCAQEKPIVYLIEDDEYLAEYLRGQLSQLHYDIKVIPDLNTLKGVMSENKLTLAIVDVRLPDGKSTNYFIKVKQEHPNLQLIFTSAIDDMRTRVAAVQAGGLYFLKKPAAPSRLMQLIDRFMQPDIDTPGRVLIVPNQHSQTKEISARLTEAGHEICTVDTPWRTLTSAETFLPDLILLAPAYPDCSGAELARALRQEDEFLITPILFMPNNTTANDDTAINSAESDGILENVNEPERLLEQVSCKIKHHRKLSNATQLDSLTGAYRKPAFLRHAQRDFQSAHAHKTDLSIAIIAIDNLPQIQEQYGQKVGGRIVCNLAHYLRKKLPANSKIGHYDREQLIICMPNTDGNSAMAHILEIREDFNKHCRIDNLHAAYTISAGIADYPNYDTMPELLYYADQSLSESQRTGQNRVKWIK